MNYQIGKGSAPNKTLPSDSAPLDNPLAQANGILQPHKNKKINARDCQVKISRIMNVV